MTRQPTILLGVGATKAGTSWLFDQLEQHPECHLRAIKELHYFNTVKNGRWKQRIDGLKERAVNARPGGKVETDALELVELMRLRRLSLHGYMEYLLGGRGERHVVADITPAYSLLPERVLSRVASLGDVRVLYLLRDPVSRLWSQVRMDAQRQAVSEVDVKALAHRKLEEALSQQQGPAWARGDYATVVPKLQAAVPAGRLMIAYYETLMTPEGYGAVCDFLGIERRRADFEKRVHGGAAVELDDDTRMRAFAALRPQYDFVARHLGDVPPAWQAAMAGV